MIVRTQVIAVQLPAEIPLTRLALWKLNHGVRSNVAAQMVESFSADLLSAFNCSNVSCFAAVEDFAESSYFLPFMWHYLY